MADQAITNLDQGKPSIIKGLSAATKNSSRSTGNEWTDEIFRTQRRAKPTEKSTNTLSLGNINGHYGENVDFEDFYETQHYTLICRISQKFFESIKYIMVSRAVGIAFEGQNLGNDGTLSLIQIATESRVIMFDMIRLGNQAFGAGLRILLESEQLIKVIHDCRWISNLLRNQHQIVMANIFDTQVANAFVSRNLNGGKWPSNVESLHNCLKKYLNIPSQDLNSILIKELYIEEKEKVWLARPLPLELLNAATHSASHLLRLQRVLLAEMLVEYKAAVDIYLNYSFSAANDKETNKETRYMLPIAITHIHRCLREKAARSNRVTTQSLNSGSLGSQSIDVSEHTDVPEHPVVSEQTDVPEHPDVSEHTDVPEHPDVSEHTDVPEPVETSISESIEQQDNLIAPDTQDMMKTCNKPKGTRVQANRRKEANPKKVTRPLSQKAKGLQDKFGEEAFSDEETSSGPEGGKAFSASEKEKMDTSPEEHGPDSSKGIELVSDLPLEPLTVSRITKRPPKKKSPVQKRRAPRKRKQTYKKPTTRRFQCDICGKNFPTRGALASHMPTHSDERLFKCDICEKMFKTAVTLNGHKLIHSSERPHMCDICGKSFYVKTALRKHLQRHSGERSHYKCDICTKSYTTAPSLRYHKNTHTGLKPYKCDVCLKSFTCSSFLSQHKKIHTGLKPFKCFVCEKTFRRVYHRDMHYKRVHLQDRQYPCNYCKKSFVDVASLNYHVKIHEGIKPYKCDVCDKTFTYTSQRDIHYKKIHCEYQKQYQCTVCYLRVEGMSALVKHKRTHMEDKPYKCPACDKTFKRNDNRNAHYKRIHSGTGIFLVFEGSTDSRKTKKVVSQ